MENNGSSKTDWKEIGITAGIVLVVGFIASLAAIYAHDSIQKMAAKKSPSKETDPSKKV